MEIIYLLIGCSLTLALLFLGVFAWAVRSGQFDDTITPAHRILPDQQPGSATPAATSSRHRHASR